MANLIANSDPHLNPLDYNNLSAADMVQVDALITSGSEYIERYCNRVFASAVITDEEHNGNGFNSIFVRNPPITTLTQIEIISAYSSTGSDTYDTHAATTPNQLVLLYFFTISDIVSPDGSIPFFFKCKPTSTGLFNF